MTTFLWDASDFDWSRGPLATNTAGTLLAARQAGVAGATHKLTEGTNVMHRHGPVFLAGLRDLGCQALGGYMVPRTPGNGGNGSVAAQVAYFLNYIHANLPWLETFPGRMAQVDLEHWSSGGTVYDAVPVSVGVEACQRLQDAGWPVLLYAPRWAYGDTIPAPWRLWASDYGANQATDLKSGYPGDTASRWAAYSGREPTILQYGSKLTIGIQPSCDGNAFRGTVADLLALLGGTDMTQPSPSEVVRLITQGSDDRGYIPLTGTKDAPAMSVDPAAHYNLKKVMDAITAIPTGAALSDADRTLVDELLAAIRELNGRLAAAGATPAP